MGTKALTLPSGVTQIFRYKFWLQRRNEDYYEMKIIMKEYYYEMNIIMKWRLLWNKDYYEMKIIMK